MQHSKQTFGDIKSFCALDAHASCSCRHGSAASASGATTCDSNHLHPSQMDSLRSSHRVCSLLRAPPAKFVQGLGPGRESPGNELFVSVLVSVGLQVIPNA